MKRLFLIAAALAVSASLCFAGDPSVLIQGKAVARSGEDVVLDASGSVTETASGLVWSFEENASLNPTIVTPPNLPTNSWCILRGLKPGDYSIVVLAYGTNKANQPVWIHKQHRLRVYDGPTPDPNPPKPDPGPNPPPPPPPPTPDPTPKPAGQLFATFLYAETDRDPATLAAKSTQKIRDELAKIDTVWHAFDASTPGIVDTFRAIRTPPPCLIVTDAKGVVIRDIPLPASPDKIIETIRSLR